MLDIVVAGGLIAAVVTVFTKPEARPWEFGDDPRALVPVVLAETDLPCPWCRTATREEDTRCPSCHQRFG